MALVNVVEALGVSSRPRLRFLHVVGGVLWCEDVADSVLHDFFEIFIVHNLHVYHNFGNKII
jgi:hypothetical protein